VGGVSERAGAKAGGSNPFAHIVFLRGRGGERHPGLREGGALRGALSERRPRSVRERAAVSSVTRKRAGDSGCPKAAEEGNVVGMRVKSACTRRRHERSLHALGDASFARSFDPCTSILTMHRGSNPRWWGARGGITAGQTTQVEEPALGPKRTDGARLAACHRFRKGAAWHERRRKEVEASVPCEDPKSPGLVARTSVVVAEVGRRRLASNKLGKRAPKRAVRVE